MTSLVHSTGGSATRRLMVQISVLAVAFAALFAIATADQAKAVPAVGNPGTFTVTWGSAGSDGFRWAPNDLNEGNFPISGQNGGGYQVNVDANGNITPITYPSFQSGVSIYTSCLTGAFLCIGAPSGVKSSPEAGNNGSWTGSINPTSGVINLAMPMRVRMQSNSGSSINDCYVGSNASPISINPSTSNSGGTPYNFATGTARVTDSGFNSPAPGGANGGSGSSYCDRTNSYPSVGLPSTDTHAYISMTIKNGSGVPVKPWPVRAELSISPEPVGVGQTATLDASASAVDDGVQACAVPSPAEPDCGYRWDFDNNGSIDAVTNTPTTTTTYATAGTATSAVTIYDVNGKASDPTTASVTVQSLPLAQVDSGPATTKELASVFTFSIPSNPYSATFLCSLDGATFAACDSGDTFNAVQALDTTGSHNFRVRGITPGGVIGPIDTYNWTIDRVLPRVTIAPGSLPADPTQDTSADFQLTADKPGSSLECQIDSGTWDACGTNSVGSQAYSGLASDPATLHTFKVRATDSLGNIGGDGNPGGAEYQWTVDLEAPQVTFSSTPTDPSSNTSPSFGWTNNEPISSAQCRLDRGIGNGAWGPCDGLTTSQVHNLQDGNYHFKVRTIDIAGNFSPVATYSWQIETVNPNLEITRAPAVNAKRSVAVFEYVYEAGTTATCQIDAQPVQDPCTSNFGPGDPGTLKGKISYDFLAEGAHTFSVTVEDIAANTTTQVFMWNVKTIQPLISIDPGSVPAAAALDGNASFVLTTANGDAECQLDGSGWAPCDSNSAQSYTGLADGFHTFEARGTDASDNKSAIDEYSWLVVSQAPQITFNSTPAANTKMTTAPFTYTVVSADPGVQTVCSVDGGGDSACSSPTILTGLADGAHTIDVTATDAAGTQTTESYGWNVKAKIPGLGFDSTPDAHSNSAVADFAFSSDEDPNVTYDCKLDGNAWAPCTSPKQLTGLSNGNHSFSIRATDSVTNAAVEQFDWNVDTAAPTVSFTQTPAASTTKVAELVKFNASESGVSYTCKLDSGSAAPCSSPWLLENLSIGAHTLLVHATDAAGNTGADAAVNWTINAVAPAVRGSGVLRTAAVCPGGLDASCTVTVRAFTSKTGKPVSKKKTVRLKSGQKKQVKLKQNKLKSGKVVIRQKIKAGKKHKVRYRKANSAKARG
ncbi:MAG: hypothetical protein WBW44_04685 [Solirubrobacterales bacterium]